LSGAGGPLVILPEDYKVKERSVYVEVEFSPENLGNFRWVVWSIQTVIEECNGRTAD
jgi:hypothetical protein